MYVGAYHWLTSLLTTLVPKETQSPLPAPVADIMNHEGRGRGRAYLPTK